MTLSHQQYSSEKQNWESVDAESLQFWPINERDVKALIQQGYRQESWHNRKLACRFDLYDSEVRFYFEGRLIKHWSRTDAATGTSLSVRLQAGDEIADVTKSSLPSLNLYEAFDLSFLARQRLPRPVKLAATHLPFVMPGQGHAVLDLSQAGWTDQKRDPADFYAAYDKGAYTLNDAHMPMLSIPKADYVAAHVVASARADSKSTNVITLRVGRYGGRRQVIRQDYSVPIPERGADNFQVSRIPMTDTIAQDVLHDILDVELTKQVRLARHVPDPNRFNRRPLGLSSGVRVAGITFEKSPLQMRVSASESGNAFVEPKQPVFMVRLENITARAQPFVLEGKARHLRGAILTTRISGNVAPNQTSTSNLRFQPTIRGYHDLEVELKDGAGNVLLRRKTSFATLPPDRRQHRARSPFGTWEWGGAHVTSKDSNLVGSLYQKLGFRFGMSHHPFEARRKWGTAYAFEPKLDPLLARYEILLAKNPDLPKVALQFHEHSISRRHAMRVPDLFTDRAPFQLNTEEKEKYDKMLADALEASNLLRKKYPATKISFGNGVPATKEEFYRRGLPAQAFDFGGNEAGSFHRLPEAQPPDFIALNASIWMDRQLLDAYGYTDKAVHQSYETCYPGDSPGNLSSRTQAEYFARHALHSLSWGMKSIHIGMLMDVGNSYYYSNWGSSGFLRAIPEVNVKPAFIAMATLTRVLDGAKFLRAHNTGSASLYALEFLRPDGQRVLAYWTVRGERQLMVKREGSSWRVVDDQGNEAREVESIRASTAPNYLVGKGKVLSVVAGQTNYADTPPNRAWVVATFAKPDLWKKLSGRSHELEEYDFMTPRRKGRFRLETVAGFEGLGPSLQASPMPIQAGKETMPMYERMALVHPVVLPETPNEIGVWINGNSGWGRVVFELRDARGQRWISLGAQAEYSGKPMSDWSTDDPYGLSAINFDGWRYVGFPLPGNYRGEMHPWPGNSNWRWGGDGVVHYPLRLVGVALVLRSKVLQLQSWSPPPRSEIYLQDIMVGWRDSWLE